MAWGGGTLSAVSHPHSSSSSRHARVTQRSAGLATRAVAYLCDLAIMLAIGAFAIAAMHDAPVPSDLVYALSLLLSFLLQWGYGTAFDWLAFGRTPGKALFGLRAVQDDGGAMGLRAAATRNLLRALDALPGLYALGVGVAALEPGGRRLGDIVAGTRVVVRDVELAGQKTDVGVSETADVSSVLHAARLLVRDADLLPKERRMLAFERLSALVDHGGRRGPSAEAAVRAYVERKQRNAA